MTSPGNKLPVSETQTGQHDFRLSILEAVHQAPLPDDTLHPLASDTDAVEISGVMSRFMSDEAIIVSELPRARHEVTVTDPAQYRLLIEQAIEVTMEANGEGKPAPEQLAESSSWIDEAVAHERMHGGAAVEWGNSETRNHFGVSFYGYREGDDIRYDFVPFHRISGPLRKVHRAAAAAAPGREEMSDPDWQVVNALGYGDDLEALQKAADATPGVPEGWVPSEDDPDALMRIRSMLDEVLGQTIQKQ